MANQNEYGPTYKDVEDYVAEIKGTYGHAVRFEVIAPLRRQHEQLTGWIVRAVTWHNEGHRTVEVHAASASYQGASGFKTMPAAMYRCCFEVWNKYCEAESEAERQAHF